MPAQCKITYECTSVVRLGEDQDPLISCSDFDFDGVIDGTSDDGVLIFTPTVDDYTNGTYEPGEYEVTITGTPDKATDGRTDTVKITIILLDPCASPTITVPELEDQVYRLTSDAKPYEHPLFTVEPSICKITLTYDVQDLNAGDSAIVRDDRTFTIFYNNDDAPISPVAQT